MNMQQLLQGGFGQAAGLGMDAPTIDTAEMVHISSLALLKVKRPCWLVLRQRAEELANLAGVMREAGRSDGACADRCSSTVRVAYTLRETAVSPNDC